MGNNWAIGGITNPYSAMGNMYDPYFLAALNSVNVNNPSFRGAASGVSAQNEQTDLAALTEATYPTYTNHEPKKSKAGKVLVGTVLAAGAAALCIAGHKKGNVDLKFFPRIWDGLKNIFKGTKTKATEVVSKLSSKAKNGVVSVSGEGDKAIVSLPGKFRTIETADIKAMEEIGTSISTASLKDMVTTVDGNPVLKEGVKIKDFIYGKGGNIFKFRNTQDGLKLVSFTKNGAAENLLNPTEQVDIDALKKAKETVGELFKKNDFSKFRQIRFRETANGVSRVFTAADGKSQPVLNSLLTTKYNINDDVITLYRANNTGFDDAVKKFLSKDYSGFKEASKDFVHSSLGTFHITDGQITSVTKPDKSIIKAGSDEFKIFSVKHADIMENILKQKPEKYTNVVRIPA